MIFRSAQYEMFSQELFILPTPEGSSFKKNYLHIWKIEGTQVYGPNIYFMVLKKENGKRIQILIQLVNRGTAMLTTFTEKN